MVVDIILG